MNDFEETQKLIRLKRYETPPEGYFDDFLDEFHQRQRAELMRRSSRSLFFERLGTYLSSFGSSRLMLAGGAAAAIALAFVVARPKPGNHGGTAGLPENIDQPKGKVTPVSTNPSPAADRNLVDDEATGAMRFRVEPRAAVNAETQTFEL